MENNFCLIDCVKSESKNQFRFLSIISVVLCLFALSVSAQEDIYEALLKQEVEVENPVYMPVIGIGSGVMRYYGDLHNASGSMLMGNRAININVTTFIGKKHYFKGNAFLLLLGSLAAEQYSLNNPDNNFNFHSELTTIGINIQYNFEHFVKPDRKLHPFVFAGFEIVQFASRTDMLNNAGNPYLYMPDGTIQDAQGHLVFRNYHYESDMRKAYDFGMGNYSSSTSGIPLGFGFELSLSNRAFIQLGLSYHYMFTDLLDHVSPKNIGGPMAKKGNDMYTYSFLSFHYDLFSDPKTVTIKHLFADIDFDYTMYGDEDNDWVFDRVDKCPGTPDGVEVDSVGCPLDADNDGVPDYLDMDPNTRPGAIVNNLGVEITLESLFALMTADAVTRDEVKAILRSNLNNKYFSRMSIKIPPKFKKIDVDEDGYISFEELLFSIDKYFDGDLDLDLQDINELKDFFFSQ